jgi:hypothetical protein
VAPDADLGALLGALKEKGVELSFFPERKVPGGVQAGGLELRLVQAPPPQVASGVDVLVSTITLGGNQATVDNRALPSSPLFSGPAGGPPGSATATAAPGGFTSLPQGKPSTASETAPALGPAPSPGGAESPPWSGEAPPSNGSPADSPVSPPAPPPGGASQAALGTEAITAEGLRVRLGAVYPILMLSVFVAAAVAGSFRRLTGQRRA